MLLSSAREARRVGGATALIHVCDSIVLPRAVSARRFKVAQQTGELWIESGVQGKSVKDYIDPPRLSYDVELRGVDSISGLIHYTH